MTFLDTYRSGGAPLDTRAECDAADQRALDLLAADIAAEAHALTDDLGAALDRHEEDWRDEHHDRLVNIRALLTRAKELVGGLA